MHQIGVFKGSLMWLIWNLAIEALWRRNGRYLRLRYEDLVTDPQHRVADILDFLGEGHRSMPFLLPHREVLLGGNHSVSGNPDRFRRGRIRLELDEEWRKSMLRSERHAVTSATWPLLRRYGYH